MEEQHSGTANSGYRDEYGHSGNRHAASRTLHIGGRLLGGRHRHRCGSTIAVLQALNVLDISEPIRIALIALVGAGILAWAIAAAGDSLARAYGLAHVTRTDPTKENEPAIKTAAFKLAEVYAAANPAVDAQKAATAAQVRLCAFPVPLQVRAQGSDAQAVALFVSGEVGKE